MVDCDYCDASFDSEDAYLEHLGAAHEGELGSIDRRRVDEHSGGSDDGGSIPTGPAILVGVIGFSLAIVVYVVVFMGGSGGGGGGPGLPDQGDQAVISEVTTHNSAGRDHVSNPNYERLPPTSGPHSPSWATGGFYTADDAPPLSEIVHSLEHGAVVVYYDPAGVSSEARQSMQQFGNRYTDDFMSFIAVPTPVEDPEATYVVTAWTKQLTMDTYDEETVRQFTAEYLGRGPENQVR